MFQLAMRPDVKKYDGRHGPKRAEIKLDGYRCTVIRDSTGKTTAIGKKEYIDLWPSLSQLHHHFEFVPNSTVLDGELHAPGVLASSIVTLIKEQSPKLKFQPFAIPFYESGDFRFHTFENADYLLNKCRFDPPSILEGGIEYATTETATELGIEGFVLKEFPYDGWWKVKPQHTVDVFVTGWKPGAGKHHGRIGSLECSVFLANGISTVVANVGKGNDDLWRDLNPAELMFRVLEINHEGVQALGKLRFSNFVRWREDKPAQQCTMDQLT